MKYSVDRMEGDKVLLISPGGVRRIVARSMLPEKTGQGSCVLEKNGVFVPDPESENVLRRTVYALQERLKNKKRRG